MADELTGKTIAFLVAQEGIEQVELTDPWKKVEEAGGRPILVAPDTGTVQAFDHLDAADTFPVDRTTADLAVDDIDGVVLPGGVANPDQLRTDESAVSFLRDFVEAGKPVVLEGRTITSWPSLQTDIRNAGGTWVDEEVCRDGNLVSSRNPDDLPAFTEAMVELFA
jgi:protease I